MRCVIRRGKRLPEAEAARRLNREPEWPVRFIRSHFYLASRLARLEPPKRLTIHRSTKFGQKLPLDNLVL
jgi:hypothetical protein